MDIILYALYASPMSTPLSTAILEKQKADGLSSIGAVADAIGVGYSSLDGLLRKGTKPNKATRSKYAKWLGVSETEIDALSSGKAKAKAAAPAKKAAAPAKKAGKPAAKPARKAKAAAPKASRGPAGILAEAIDVVGSLVSDDLAIAVHEADEGTREVIARILGC